MLIKFIMTMSYFISQICSTIRMPKQQTSQHYFATLIKRVVTIFPDLISLTRLKQSPAIPCVFGVKLPNESNENAVRPHRKLEIQYGGHQNESTHSSACRPVKNVVSTAKPMITCFPDAVATNKMLQL